MWGIVSTLNSVDPDEIPHYATFTYAAFHPGVRLFKYRVFILFKLRSLPTQLTITLT